MAGFREGRMSGGGGKPRCVKRDVPKSRLWFKVSHNFGRPDINVYVRVTNDRNFVDRFV